MIVINIAKDFSEVPGGRYIDEGDFSGEQFRDEILVKKYDEAEENNEILQVIFDGTYGFGTSFLEESFGGLVRKYKKRNVLNRIELISTEDETIPGNIKKYITEAEEQLKNDEI